MCDFLCNIIPDIFGIIFRAGKNIFANSAILNVVANLGNKMYILLGAYFALIVVVPHDYWNNVFAFGAAVILFLIFCFNSAKNKKRLRVDKIGFFLPVFVLAVVYAFISSISPSLSFRFLIFYVTAIIAVLLIVSEADNAKKLTAMISIVLASVTFAGIYACIQRISGVKVVENQVDLSLELNKNMPGRVYGTFGNPNNFAELLVLTIPFFIAVFLNSKTAKGKIAAFIGVLPALVAIAMTYSRSGWIGLVIAMLIFVTFKNWRVLPLVIIIGLLMLPILPQSIMNRILTIGNLEDSSTSYRFLIFESFSGMLKDVWARGIGLGSDVIFLAVKSYKQLVNGHYPVHAHNNYIQLLAEMGVVGILSYLAMMFNTIKSGCKLAARGNLPTEYKNYAIAGISALAGLMVISVAEYTWFYPRVMFMFWMVLAITIASYSAGKNAQYCISEE